MLLKQQVATMSTQKRAFTRTFTQQRVRDDTECAHRQKRWRLCQPSLRAGSARQLISIAASWLPRVKAHSWHIMQQQCAGTSQSGL